MRKQNVTCTMWPTDIAALVSLSKASEFPLSVVLSTLARIGIEAIKKEPVSKFRERIIKLEAKSAVDQMVINKEKPGSKYSMRVDEMTVV